jgi:hypothetical protein
MAYSEQFSDVLERRGFISKESILLTVSQEQIFQLVFGFLPQDSQYTTSPLRGEVDKTPNCWFSYHINGVLYFVDFAATAIRVHSDCFNVVQDFFKLPSFYSTLDFIYNTLIKGKKSLVDTVVQKQETKIIEQEKVKIIIEARPFNLYDKAYWSQYEITKEQLIEDKVFSVNKFYALNTKKGHIISSCQDLAYSYNDFPDGKKKLYFPNRVGKGRFLTNCSKDDVGGINSLPPYGKQLIVTKSLKDYRVLKNNGKNVVWFQNEGMMPTDKIMNRLVKDFVNIIVWFDNDQAGLTASEKVKQHINSLVPNKAKNLWLPEMALTSGIKDPSDCLAKDKQYFQKFIKTFL